MTDDPERAEDVIGGSTATPEADAKENRSKARRELIIMLVVLVLIFGVFLPQFIDYGQVIDSILKLTVWQVILLTVLGGLVKTWFDAGVYNTLIPGLRWWDGWKAWASSNSVAFVAPPGADLAIRYGMYRTAGIKGQAAGAGIVLSWFFTTGYKLVVPVLALVAFVVFEGTEDTTVLTITLIGAAAVFGGIGLLFLIMYRETIALRIGNVGGRWYNGLVGGRWKFPEAVDAGVKLVEFRGRTIGTLRERWFPALVVTLIAQAIFFITLVMSMRYMGVTAEEASIALIFDAYAIGLLLSMIPIFPGGIGVVELAYVWVIAGEVTPESDLANQIMAGAFVHRIFTWLVPILIGLIPLAAWRRKMVRREEEEASITADRTDDG